jgi:hypothetical protein
MAWWVQQLGQSARSTAAAGAASHVGGTGGTPARPSAAAEPVLPVCDILHHLRSCSTTALVLRMLQDFRVPREVVWLNGAPGSGKVRSHKDLIGPVVPADYFVTRPCLPLVQCLRVTASVHANPSSSAQPGVVVVENTHKAARLCVWCWQLTQTLHAAVCCLPQGINTDHILKTRGLTKHFTISGLLVSPAASGVR